jgi:hypothetical protein
MEKNERYSEGESEEMYGESGKERESEMVRMQ